MKSLTALATGLVSAFASGVASAQNGNMMDGSGWMGGYGGYWGPIVLVVVVGVVVWAVMQTRK